MDKGRDGWVDKRMEARQQERRLGRIPMGGDGKAALWWKAFKLLSSSAWGLELYKSKMSRRHWSCLALFNETQTQRQNKALSPLCPVSAPAPSTGPPTLICLVFTQRHIIAWWISGCWNTVLRQLYHTCNKSKITRQSKSLKADVDGSQVGVLQWLCGTFQVHFGKNIYEKAN